MNIRAYSYSDARYAFGFCETLPVGLWQGRLIFKAWGKSMCLHCFFEHLETGEQHVIAAFRTREGPSRYTPKDGIVDFSEPGLEDNVYTLETALNRKGNPAWISAELIGSTC